MSRTTREESAEFYDKQARKCLLDQTGAQWDK